MKCTRRHAHTGTGTWRTTGVLALCALLACSGCAHRRWQADYYTVRTGDTLYSIAFKHGLDVHDLARWNHIDNPARIHPGLRLQLFPPPYGAHVSTTSQGAKAAAPAGAAKRTPPVQAQAQPAAPKPAPVLPSIEWRWPASGTVVARFGDPSSVGKGIDIAGRIGDDIRAAAAGRVVYTGSGLIGYGKLIIIKHDETFLSAYAHNDSLLVEQGAQVSAGQRVATMGQGPGQRPLLHFEIRVDGKPVDPLTYLPPR